jgi:hypothetical protein
MHGQDALSGLAKQRGFMQTGDIGRHVAPYATKIALTGEACPATMRYPNWV